MKSTGPTTFQKIYHLLTLNGKKKLYGLLLAVIVMAVLDMVGVASIFPFLNVISDPDIINRHETLKWFYDTFRFESKNSFLITLGLCSFALLVVSNVLRAQINVALIRFSYLKRTILSRTLLEKYLHEPYAFFLNRNTSELMAYLASEIAMIVSGVLIPCLQVFARGLMAVFIIALLMYVNPVVACVVIAVIGGGYAVMYGLLKKTLARLGEEMTGHNKRIYKALNEVFGGIKDIKILGREKIFIERFSESVQKSNNCACWKFIIFQMPRYAFEILVFGGMLSIVIFIAVIQNNYQSVIPVVGLYAFAAYRLMPTLQQIYQDVASIRSSLYSLDVVYRDFQACDGIRVDHRSDQDQTMPLLREVRLTNVSFHYPLTDKTVLNDFNLTIAANSVVGIVGGTGAGKTTLVDILLGLLSPQEGEIHVDGVRLEQNNLPLWQRNIGYIPQQIYLCDDTVTRNIAFGVPDEDVDHQAVQNAARLACIDEFITRELPKGYETEVGERGVRLSGGQRQRLGIARALYHNPSLLVFDEATSALDGITEDAILEAVHNLAHKKTIIIIAHRLSTVKECNQIYFLDLGRVIDQGTYDELLENNPQFRQMAKLPKREDKTFSGI